MKKYTSIATLLIIMLLMCSCGGNEIEGTWSGHGRSADVELKIKNDTINLERTEINADDTPGNKTTIKLKYDKDDENIYILEIIKISGFIEGVDSSEFTDEQKQTLQDSIDNMNHNLSLDIDSSAIPYNLLDGGKTLILGNDEDNFMSWMTDSNKLTLKK